MVEGSFLTAELAHPIGAFQLEANFALHARWSVLFGPSGAGKSTILRILAGLQQPRSGSIALHNRRLLSTQNGISVPAGERSIGFVTQQPALFPHMSVHGNIAFGLHGRERNRRDDRVAEMLRLFHIDGLADRLPDRLSGGEYQRVALARTLAPEPKLLLLDEPFSGLDSELKVAILEDLSAWLDAHQVPALYVSHDVAEAYQTGADVIVIENGRIERQGPVHEVLALHREKLLRQLGAI